MTTDIKVGTIINFPLGVNYEILKVTDEYIIVDVENDFPLKLKSDLSGDSLLERILKNGKPFQELDSNGTY